MVFLLRSIFWICRWADLRVLSRTRRLRRRLVGAFRLGFTLLTNAMDTVRLSDRVDRV